MTKRTQVPLNTTDWLLLGFLAHRPSSGYDLRNRVETTGPYLGYSTSLSPIYRSLARLVDMGYARFDTEERNNAPDAKVYSLTETGRAVLKAWAETPHQPSSRPMDTEFTRKFLLAGAFGPRITLDILRRELDYRIEQKKVDAQPLYQDPDTLDPIPEIDRDWLLRIQRLGHARGYMSTAAYIAWLEVTIAELENDLARQEPGSLTTPSAVRD